MKKFIYFYRKFRKNQSIIKKNVYPIISKNSPFSRTNLFNFQEKINLSLKVNPFLREKLN